MSDWKSADAAHSRSSSAPVLGHPVDRVDVVDLRARLAGAFAISRLRVGLAALVEHEAVGEDRACRAPGLRAATRGEQRASGTSRGAGRSPRGRGRPSRPWAPACRRPTAAHETPDSNQTSTMSFSSSSSVPPQSGHVVPAGSQLGSPAGVHQASAPSLSKMLGHVIHRPPRRRCASRPQRGRSRTPGSACPRRAGATGTSRAGSRSCRGCGRGPTAGIQVVPVDLGERSPRAGWRRRPRSPSRRTTAWWRGT